MPFLANVIDVIIPKKSNIVITKWYPKRVPLPACSPVVAKTGSTC